MCTFSVCNLVSLCTCMLPARPGSIRRAAYIHVLYCIALILWYYVTKLVARLGFFRCFDIRLVHGQLLSSATTLFIRYGKEEKLVNLFGIMQALVSFVQDDRDHLKLVRHAVIAQWISQVYSILGHVSDLPLPLPLPPSLPPSLFHCPPLSPFTVSLSLFTPSLPVFFCLPPPSLPPRTIVAGDHKFVFVCRGPLVFVAVVKTRQSETQV